MSIQRSVHDQDAFLNKLESRRLSISSMCSTLTELSSCCSEYVERDVDYPDAAMPPTHALSTVTNIAESSTLTNWIATIAPEFDPAPLPPQTPTGLRAVDHSPEEGPANTPAPKKKPRRRQKKKKKTPADDEVAVVRVDHKHQRDRMQKFKMLKAAEKSKKTRMESARAIKVLKGVTPIPFELGHFRLSLKVKHELRVYRHEELEALGVRTIPWDGQ